MAESACLPFALGFGGLAERGPLLGVEVEPPALFVPQRKSVSVHATQASSFVAEGARNMPDA